MVHDYKTIAQQFVKMYSKDDYKYLREWSELDYSLLFSSINKLNSNNKKKIADYLEVIKNLQNYHNKSYRNLELLSEKDKVFGKYGDYQNMKSNYQEKTSLLKSVDKEEYDSVLKDQQEWYYAIRQAQNNYMSYIMENDNSNYINSLIEGANIIEEFRQTINKNGQTSIGLVMQQGDNLVLREFDPSKILTSSYLKLEQESGGTDKTGIALKFSRERLMRDWNEGRLEATKQYIIGTMNGYNNLVQGDKYRNQKGFLAQAYASNYLKLTDRITQGKQAINGLSAEKLNVLMQRRAELQTNGKNYGSIKSEKYGYWNVTDRTPWWKEGDVSVGKGNQQRQISIKSLIEGNPSYATEKQIMNGLTKIQNAIETSAEYNSNNPFENISDYSFNGLESYFGLSNSESLSDKFENAWSDSVYDAWNKTQGEGDWLGEGGSSITINFDF